MSSELWWVMNGRADAPPGMGWRIGVSTSMYPRSLKNSRIVAMILARRTKVSFTCGLTIRSKYRWR